MRGGRAGGKVCVSPFVGVCMCMCVRPTYRATSESEWVYVRGLNLQSNARGRACMYVHGSSLQSKRHTPATYRVPESGLDVTVDDVDDTLVIAAVSCEVLAGYDVLHNPAVAMVPVGRRCTPPRLGSGAREETCQPYNRNTNICPHPPPGACTKLADARTLSDRPKLCREQGQGRPETT